MNYIKNADMAAYPQTPEFDLDNKAYSGLTKREIFAMHAMQGLCANSIPGSHTRPNNLTREAIEYADKLLAALEDNQQ